jgi:hypothetical protein
VPLPGCSNLLPRVMTTAADGFEEEAREELMEI